MLTLSTFLDSAIHKDQGPSRHFPLLLVSSIVPQKTLVALYKIKMTILGIGVDILHLPRLRRVLLNHPERFLTRILTKSEQAEFRAIQEKAGGKIDHDGPVQFLGARYLSSSRPRTAYITPERKNTHPHGNYFISSPPIALPRVIGGQ